MMQRALFYNWLDIRVPGPPNGDLGRNSPELTALQAHLISTPRLVEAFGTKQARDRAAGPVDEHYAFIPIAAAALAVNKHAGYELAIGHQLGDRMFNEVAAAVLPSVRHLVDIDHPSSVVIARVRYHRVEHGWRGAPVWSMTAHLASGIVRTEQWLNRVMPGRHSETGR